MKKQDLVVELLELENRDGFDIKDAGNFTYGIRMINMIDIDMIVYSPYGGVPIIINLDDYRFGMSREEMMNEIADEMIGFLEDHSDDSIENMKMVRMGEF